MSRVNTEEKSSKIYLMKIFMQEIMFSLIEAGNIETLFESQLMIVCSFWALFSLSFFLKRIQMSEPNWLNNIQIEW